MLFLIHLHAYGYTIRCRSPSGSEEAEIERQEAEYGSLLLSPTRTDPLASRSRLGTWQSPVVDSPISHTSVETQMTSDISMIEQLWQEQQDLAQTNALYEELIRLQNVVEDRETAYNALFEEVEQLRAARDASTSTASATADIYSPVASDRQRDTFSPNSVLVLMRTYHTTPHTSILT